MECDVPVSQFKMMAAGIGRRLIMAEERAKEERGSGGGVWRGEQ